MNKIAEILENRKTNEHYTFDQWLGFLDGVALTFGWKSRLVRQTGSDAWLDYYENGYTPIDALREDCSYAN